MIHNNEQYIPTRPSHDPRHGTAPLRTTPSTRPTAPQPTKHPMAYSYTSCAIVSSQQHPCAQHAPATPSQPPQHANANYRPDSDRVLGSYRYMVRYILTPTRPDRPAFRHHRTSSTTTAQSLGWRTSNPPVLSSRGAHQIRTAVGSQCARAPYFSFSIILGSR